MNTSTDRIGIAVHILVKSFSVDSVQGVESCNFKRLNEIIVPVVPMAFPRLETERFCSNHTPVIIETTDPNQFLKSR